MDDREDRSDYPSYTRVYKTIRRACVEQQQIIEAGKDLTLMSLAFKLLSNVEELVLVFQQTWGREGWEGDYQQVYDMTQQRSYKYHIQQILAALKGCSMSLKFIQLTCLEPPDEPPSGSWDTLTTPLTELVGHAPGLRLVESGLPLALLCRVSLNIRELALCSIYMELPLIESFLQCNVQSLRSLGVHNVEVIDHGKLTPLTAIHIGDIIGLTIEREERLGNLSCLRSFQQGWKVFFITAVLYLLPRLGKGSGESHRRDQSRCYYC